MLELALRANLPLITCTTTDTIHAEKIIRRLFGALDKVKEDPPGFYKTKPCGLDVFFDVAAVKNYASLIANNLSDFRTTVIVNPEEYIPEAYDAGEVPVPKSMMFAMLQSEFDIDMDDLAKFVEAVSGLTLKQAREVCMMAMAKSASLTVDSVRDVRQQTTAVVRGVHAVSTALPYFHSSETLLEGWVSDNAQFFLNPKIDYRIRPRGLLLNGDPGTGKTMSAKWVASTLNVPLFRLDLGALMSKYVGESEENQSKALAVISQNEPCVMLVDEAEKLFKGDEDSGVTQNLLAGLLWWLEEHRVRVLTIMTTNDMDAIPKELIRPGRIDKAFTFGPVKNVDEFAEGLVLSLKLDALEVLDYEALPDHAPAAEITSLVMDQVREYLRSN